MKICSRLSPSALTNTSSRTAHELVCQISLLRLRPDHAAERFERLIQIDSGRGVAERPSLDPCKVQHVVDQSQQVALAAPNAREVDACASFTGPRTPISISST